MITGSYYCLFGHWVQEECECSASPATPSAPAQPFMFFNDRRYARCSDIFGKSTALIDTGTTLASTLFIRKGGVGNIYHVYINIIWSYRNLAYSSSSTLCSRAGVILAGLVDVSRFSNSISLLRT